MVNRLSLHDPDSLPAGLKKAAPHLRNICTFIALRDYPTIIHPTNESAGVHAYLAEEHLLYSARLKC